MMARLLSMLLFISVGIILTGCSSQQDAAKLNGSWRVEDIDQGGVMDYAMVNMQFDGKGRVAGSTGCNRYSGTITAEDGRIKIAKVISTRKACVSALNMQEQRFLAALNAAASYKINNNALVIYDDADKPRLRLIKMTDTAKTNTDIERTATFQCKTNGKVVIHFFGQQTAQISINGQTHKLDRAISGSGARYTGENIVFWNKGNEATLSLGDQDDHCKVVTP